MTIDFLERLLKALHNPKKIINSVGILLICFVNTWGLVQISENPLAQTFMLVFGLYVEIEVQYIWGLSFAYIEWWKNSLLKTACIGYVLIGVLLAVGFFSLEISVKENLAQTLTTAKNDQQKEIEQLNTHIDYLLKQAQNETDKFGPNAQRIEELIRIDTEKRDDLKNNPVTAETVTTEQVKGNVFTALGSIEFLKWLGLTANVLKLIIFGYAVFMIYLGVMLTYWKVDLGETCNTVINNSVTSSNVTSRNIVTNNKEKHHFKAVNENLVTYDNELCACGCNRPRRAGSKYHENNCRVTYHRHNKEEAG